MGVFSLTLNSNVWDCMRGRGIALEIKVYQKDSGQWWLEDRSLEKQLTPQRTKFSLFTKWKLIAECHFPSKILFYYSAGLNWITYSYISTDSKLANKHQEFLPIRFFFFPWPHKAWAASPISVTLCQESDEEIPGRQMEITWKSCGENGDFTRTVPKETGPETHSRCSRFNMYFHQKIALLLDPFMLSYYRRITMPSRKVSK